MTTNSEQSAVVSHLSVSKLACDLLQSAKVDIELRAKKSTNSPE